MPSEHGNPQPPWWLQSGHIQTLWPHLPFSYHRKLPTPRFERKRWDTPDGDFIDVDYLWSAHSKRPSVPPVSAQGGDSQRPLLLVFHGLEGSSQSHYVRDLAHWAQALGWDLAVPHFRGCSGELNLQPRAYHAGDSAEIDWILQRFAQHHPEQSLFALGVSLGGNALLRYLGQGSRIAAPTTLQAALTVCAPLDLDRCATALEHGLSRRIYNPYFLRTMKERAQAYLHRHPALFDAVAMQGARTLREFDDAFTAPLHGFQDVADYYAQASSLPHLRHIHACPVCIVNPLNDPFVPQSCLPTKAQISSRVTLWQPENGGHVGVLRPEQSLAATAVTWLLNRTIEDVSIHSE